LFKKFKPNILSSKNKIISKVGYRVLLDKNIEKYKKITNTSEEFIDYSNMDNKKYIKINEIMPKGYSKTKSDTHNNVSNKIIKKCLNTTINEYKLLNFKKQKKIKYTNIFNFNKNLLNNKNKVNKKNNNTFNFIINSDSTDKNNLFKKITKQTNVLPNLNYYYNISNLLFYKNSNINKNRIKYKYDKNITQKPIQININEEMDKYKHFTDFDENIGYSSLENSYDCDLINTFETNQKLTEPLTNTSYKP
jgi:hypothetical protein